MYTKLKNVSIILLLFMSSYVCFAQENIWLSGDPPPQAKHKLRPSGMQHYMAFRNNRGQEKLILWPRNGETPKGSSYLDSFNTEPKIFVVSPAGDLLEYDLSSSDKGFALTYAFDLEGYHNIYLLWKEVRDETLFVHVAKAERLNHKCQNGHRSISGKIKVKSFPEIVPFEIIRNRFKPTEDFHLILASGNVASFSALENNEAIENVEFIFVTEKGWSKTVNANEKGIAEFQIPEDYFSKMKELNKDETYHFLLTAKYSNSTSGEYQGKAYSKISYVCTYAGDYEPSPSLYKSSFWPIIIILFSTLAIGSFIFYSRRKRRRFY